MFCYFFHYSMERQALICMIWAGCLLLLWILSLTTLFLHLMYTSAYTILDIYLRQSGFKLYIKSDQSVSPNWSTDNQTKLSEHCSELAKLTYLKCKKRVKMNLYLSMSTLLPTKMMGASGCRPLVYSVTASMYCWHTSKLSLLSML